MPPVAIPAPDREAAAKRAEAQLEALHRCLLNLLLNGVRVLSYCGTGKLGRDRVTVEVAANPQLYRIYADRCAPFRRRQEGNQTLFTWLALEIDDNIRIEWEEVVWGG